jgi:hypothetical protein
LQDQGHLTNRSLSKLFNKQCLYCLAPVLLQGATAALAAVLLSQDAASGGAVRVLLKAGLYLGPFAFGAAEIGSGVSGM